MTMADLTFDVSVSVECAKCGGILGVVFDDLSRGYVLSVDPCPTCLEEAHDEGEDEGYSQGYREGAQNETN